MAPAGGSFAQLIEARRWQLSARRLFLDLGRQGAQPAAPIFIEAFTQGPWGE